jgi:tetratricopeptide (TPR) repeat protein
VADLVRVPDERERLTELALLEAEHELAQGSAQKALELSQRIKDAGQLRGRALRLQGRALLGLDRAADAVRSLGLALDSFRATADRESHIRTLYDLAYAQARLDRPQTALMLLLQCADALRAGELVDRTFELEVESFLASAYARIGDHESAAPHLDRARSLAEDVVSHDALAAVYGQMAAAERQRGRLEQSLVLWRKCLQELEVTGRDRQVADVWHNIAVTYLRLGANAKAKASLSRAEELQRQTDHVRLGAWLKVTRAKLALEEKRLSEAERLAREASVDKAASQLARGEAQLVIAQVLSRRRAPIAKVSHAFESALTELANEPTGTRVGALKLYADALGAAGDLASAFQKSREALELLRPGH